MQRQLAIPAKAGNQIVQMNWVPAFAGMTWFVISIVSDAFRDSKET